MQCNRELLALSSYMQGKVLHFLRGAHRSTFISALEALSLEFRTGVSLEFLHTRRWSGLDCEVQEDVVEQVKNIKDGVFKKRDRK